MQVQVVLRGSLAGRIEGGRGTVDLADGETIRTLISALDLPHVPCVYVVNGAPAKASSPLKPGDRVEFFPQMAGGAETASPTLFGSAQLTLAPSDFRLQAI